MKRNLLLLMLFSLIVAASIGLSGCGTKQAVSDAKIGIDDYYTAFEAKDIDALMACMHQSLIDDLGGNEATQQRLLARMYLLGEPVNYKITNTGFETQNTTTEVNLTVEVLYKNSETMTEAFTFLTVDEGCYITGIDFPKEEIIEEVISKYLAAYGNVEEMAALSNPYALSIQGMNEALAASQKLTSVSGAYVDSEILNRDFRFVPFGEGAANNLFIGKVKANFENLSAIGEIQLSEQDGMIGVNYANFFPEDGVVLFEKYYNKMKAGDIEGVTQLYAPFFYDFIEGGKDAWVQEVLNELASNGDYQSYELTNWSYETVKMPDGTPLDVLAVDALITCTIANIEENFVFNIGDGSGAIVGHYYEYVQ